MYHWFLIFLDISFKRKYHIKYDYARHNYYLYRTKRFKVIESFSVFRSSEKCFRLFYYNCNNTFLYKSFRSARLCANFCMNLSSEFDIT